MPTPQIGPIAADEFDALATLMRETIAAIPYYNEQAKEAEYAKYTAAELRTLAAKGTEDVLVARDGATLVGFCVSRFDDATIWLSWFGTAAAARGRGVGGLLLAALQGSLPSRSAHKIWCDSRTENVESKSVLERAGFTRIATLEDHWYHQDYFLWEWLAR